MKHNIFVVLCVLGLGAAICSCEKKSEGEELVQVEGAWELKTLKSDYSALADILEDLHMTEETVRSYGDKEEVWLFRKGHISEWTWFENGSGWEASICDCSNEYVIKGEGADMQIIVTGRSSIPGLEDVSTVTNYKVEKLTKDEMILNCIDHQYSIDIDSIIDVPRTYIFKRENTLPDHVKSVFPD